MVTTIFIGVETLPSIKNGFIRQNGYFSGALDGGFVALGFHLLTI
ncbi:hypothetical protein X768_18510 [Mesorhizobium sp. LSJC265A00]|nr:hypothetical protein X768_18510 [Mesorhizobium sp. LSJC265A00]